MTNPEPSLPPRSTRYGTLPVAAGGTHTLALKQDGTVWAWGDNIHSQLGDGGTTTRSIPGPVLGLTGFVAVAAGAVHSLALKRDGTVWAWGENLVSELGDGTNIGRPRPVQLSSLTGITRIVAGNQFSLALKQDGTVWEWGLLYQIQNSDGTITFNIRTAPLLVPGLTDVVQIDSESLQRVPPVSE